MLKQLNAFNAVVSIALLLVFCSNARAPDVAGVVKDNFTGVPISGVTVIILQTGDTVVTDGSGNYFIAAVPEGYYTFLLGRSNYAPRIMTGVSVGLACCNGNRGDVNSTGVINSSDIIYLVNYVFKGGPEPLPVSEVGDVNCSGVVNSSDVIYLVNYVFKGGLAPCP